VIVNFIKQALRQEPMTIYGDGKQTRSMCFVDDLVDGLMRAMESPKSRGEIFNLGNPEEHTVLEIAELVRRRTMSTSRFVFTDPAVGDDPRMRCPDIGKARKFLEWNPSTSLDTGLKLVICEMLATHNGDPHGPSSRHEPFAEDQRGRSQRPRGGCGHRLVAIRCCPRLRPAARPGSEGDTHHTTNGSSTVRILVTGGAGSSVERRGSLHRTRSRGGGVRRPLDRLSRVREPAGRVPPR
jgi:hypothetical protein